MVADINAMPACEAAKWYQEHGFYVHPLNGKIPILKAWQERTEHLSEHELTEYFETKNKNIGLVCGEKSDTTVIDRDFIVSGIWHGLELSPVKQARTPSRDHLFYRYCAELPAKKNHALGFEILNNGNNCVLTPSIHPDGEKYQHTESPENRPVMPMELIERIKSTVNTWNALQATVSKCRHVFQAFFKSYFVDNSKDNTNFRDMSIFHGATGRELTLHLFAELKANGATTEELQLLCMLMFLDSYSSKDSEYQISKIKATATAKAATIQANPILSPFYDSERNHEPTPANTSQHQPKKEATESLTPDEEDPALKAAKESQQAKREMEVYRNLAESERISACRVIWEKHGLNGHDFKKAYDEKFRPKKKEKEEPDIEETPEHIKERAKDIAHNGNPLNFIIATHQDLHVGDIGLATTLILSTTCQHVLNTNGIQPKLSGSSGKGKSDCAMTAAHLLPQEWLLTSSLSNKAIYYMEEKLKPGTVVFLDDVILGEDMEKVINRATTFYQTGAQHTTLDINRQNVTLKIPPRLAWWLTSIDDDQSLQLLNRTFGGEVDESKEQDKRVAIRQREKAKTGEVGLPINDNILICREIIRDIKQNTYIVKIPFADAIIWRDENNRRNQPMFLDIIKAFAVLRHRQREKDQDGALLATYQDYIDAKMLYTSRQEAQKTKLTAAERKLCEVLSEKGSLTFQGLCKELNVGKSRLSQILNGKGKGHDSGALFKVKELWEEECTVKNITGGYTKQKLYGYDGEFNPLEGHESIVDYDNAVYPVYPVFTPCLPYKNVSGNIVFTLFTLKEITEQGNIIPSKIVEEVEDKKTKEVQKNEDNNILHAEQQNQGKQGKQKATDSETQKVNTGKHEGKQGKQEGKQPSRILLDTVKKYCRGWEPVKKASINSQNYCEVVNDFLKGYKLPDDMREPVAAAVMIYAKISQPAEATP